MRAAIARLGTLLVAATLAVAAIRPADAATRSASQRAGAEPPGAPPMLPGKAGSYFVLFDGAGKALLGAFWLSDNVIGVAAGPLLVAPSPDSLQAVAIDRYLFPRGAVDAYLFRLKAIDYADLPQDFAAPTPGRSFNVTGVEYLPNPLVPGDEAGKPFTMSFRWESPVSKPIRGGTLGGYGLTASHLLVFEEGGLGEEEATGARVYIPSLGFGVSRVLWDAVAEVVAGKAASSADLAFTIWLHGALPDEPRRCLTELRASDDYSRYQAALALLELRNEALIRHQVMTDIIAHGIALYSALEERYRIGERFGACTEF